MLIKIILVGFNRIRGAFDNTCEQYKYNTGYGVSAYDKGSIFLSQLKYVIGEKNFDNTLKNILLTGLLAS